MNRRLAWGGVAVSTAFILVATLHVAGRTIPPGWSFSLASGNEALAELIQNFLLFMPLGASLTLVGVPPLRAVAIGAALSFSVEFAQQWIPGRPSRRTALEAARDNASRNTYEKGRPIWSAR